MHDEQEDRRKEREAEAKSGGIDGLVLIPPSVSVRTQWLVTTVWRAEYLPVMDTGPLLTHGGDFYTMVCACVWCVCPNQLFFFFCVDARVVQLTTARIGCKKVSVMMTHVVEESITLGVQVKSITKNARTTCTRKKRKTLLRIQPPPIYKDYYY